MESYVKMKKKAAVFWDYESFFWALFNNYQYIPSRDYLVNLLSTIRERFQITQIQAFADFNNPQIKAERQKLRGLSIDVIDCTPSETRYGVKKEFTDFIMLGSIYDTLIGTLLKNNNIEAYIFITGDGHFSTVTAQITNDHNKEVGVMGIQGSLSQELKEIANWSIEIKPGVIKIEEFDDLKEKIKSSMKYAEKGGLYPSFAKTIEKCSNYYRLNSENIKLVLMNMIKTGEIGQKIIKLENGTEIKALIGDWHPEYGKG